MHRFIKAGRERLENKRLIQRYIDKTGLYQAEFAESIGVTKQALSKVINGRSHLPAVFEGLRKIGVPEELLCDPRWEGAEKPQPAVKPENPAPGFRVSYRTIAKSCGVSAATISQIMKHGKYPKKGAAELRQKIVALVARYAGGAEQAERHIPHIEAAA